jgi:hypothetical protein
MKIRARSGRMRISMPASCAWALRQRRWGEEREAAILRMGEVESSVLLDEPVDSMRMKPVPTGMRVPLKIALFMLLSTSYWAPAAHASSKPVPTGMRVLLQTLRKVAMLMFPMNTFSGETHLGLFFGFQNSQTINNMAGLE